MNMFLIGNDPHIPWIWTFVKSIIQWAVVVKFPIPSSSKPYNYDKGLLTTPKSYPFPGDCLIFCSKSCEYVRYDSTLDHQLGLDQKSPFANMYTQEERCKAAWEHCDCGPKPVAFEWSHCELYCGKNCNDQNNRVYDNQAACRRAQSTCTCSETKISYAAEDSEKVKIQDKKLKKAMWILIGLVIFTLLVYASCIFCREKRFKPPVGWTSDSQLSPFVS